MISFSVSSVYGPHTLEIRATYPNDMYVTYTLLVDIAKGQFLSATNSPNDNHSTNGLTTANIQNENQASQLEINSTNTSSDNYNVSTGR